MLCPKKSNNTFGKPSSTKSSKSTGKDSERYSFIGRLSGSCLVQNLPNAQKGEKPASREDLQRTCEAFKSFLNGATKFYQVRSNNSISTHRTTLRILSPNFKLNLTWNLMVLTRITPKTAWFIRVCWVVTVAWYFLEISVLSFLSQHFYFHNISNLMLQLVTTEIFMDTVLEKNGLKQLVKIHRSVNGRINCEFRLLSKSFATCSR